MEGKGNGSSLTAELEAQNEAGYSSLKEGNVSFSATVFNSLNTIVGIGIILLPYALASGGWLSLILLFALSMAVTYTGILIKRCMEVDPMIKTYTNIGEHAFGYIGKIIVSIILYSEIYMSDAGCLILEGDNLHTLFPDVAIRAFGLTIHGRSSFIIMTSLVLLPSAWPDNLSILAYISAGGILASFLILGSVLWIGLFEWVEIQPERGSLSLLNFKGLPTAISLYTFCYTGHSVIPTLYTSMRKKPKFCKVLILCFCLSTVVNVSMAVIGYMMFGSSVESQITLSLPVKKIASHVAIFSTLIIPLAKYALVLKPMVILTESWFPLHLQKKRVFKILVRTMLVATQLMLALALPFFGHLMSLVGALLSAVTTLTIPCLCYLKIARTNAYNMGVFERVIIWGIVISSIFIALIGTYTSVLNIVEAARQ